MNSRNQMEDRRASARRIRELQFLGNKRQVQLCPSIERRSVTSRYHGSTISITTLHVRHTILYISLPSLHHYDMKLPTLQSPLYGVGEHIQKLPLSFLDLDNDRYGRKENFLQI